MPWRTSDDRRSATGRAPVLSAPHASPRRRSSAVSVRVTPGADLYLAVGAGRRRMYLTPDEAWALWRCLSEAVASLGQPPEWIRTTVTAKPR